MIQVEEEHKSKDDVPEEPVIGAKPKPMKQIKKRKVNPRRMRPPQGSVLTQRPLPKNRRAQEPATGQRKQPKESSPVPVILGSLKVVRTGMERLEQDVKSIVESSGKTAGEIREMHKLYHNEFANRLRSMQEEIERYREAEKGRVFDSILGEIAKLYSGNESVIEDIADDNIKKRIRYMFEDILQILEANGVSMLKSKHGDKRNTRHCQVVERIPTENPGLHDTVVSSRGTGFYVENRSLVKEPVDIYIFADTNAGNLAEK
jgi:molecular chaperone GrpE (heat shock protein)